MAGVPVNIISPGFNYKKLPQFSKVISESGTDANIVAQSKTIGRIKSINYCNWAIRSESITTTSSNAKFAKGTEDQ